MTLLPIGRGAVCALLAAAVLMASAPAGHAEQRTSHGLVFFFGRDLGPVSGMALIKPRSRDVVYRDWDPEREFYAMTFLYRLPYADLAIIHEIIEFGQTFQEREKALGLYPAEYSSVDSAIPDRPRGQCIGRGPAIFPLQKKLARAVIVMIENGDGGGNDDEPSKAAPPTVLLKLRLEGPFPTLPRYVFEMKGERTLDRRYCGDEKRLVELIGKFASE
jgi:hypothetical protein